MMMIIFWLQQYDFIFVYIYLLVHNAPFQSPLQVHTAVLLETYTFHDYYKYYHHKGLL